jgi:SAM-dependent methyltransferase
MDAYRLTNREHWDEATDVHVASDFYDLAAFKTGKERLHGIEIAELGDVTGKSLLHLQCHFGMDTISWARKGATVTGLDFSPRAISTARALASELDVPARFIETDLYAAPEVLDEQFDIVFTSYGAIYWLSDIHRWGEIAASFVKPGGTFYIAEFHPFGFIFDNDDPNVTDYIVKYPYFFTPEPIEFDGGDYADPDAAMKHTRTYSWAHSMSDIVSAIIDAGLQIEHFHEFPVSAMKQFPWLEETDGRLWRAPADRYQMPMLFSIKARKP